MDWSRLAFVVLLLLLCYSFIFCLECFVCYIALGKGWRHGDRLGFTFEAEKELFPQVWNVSVAYKES
jgi:hypothetical protein